MNSSKNKLFLEKQQKNLLNEQDFENQLDLYILFLIIIPATPTAYNATFVVSLVSDDLLAGLSSSISNNKTLFYNGTVVDTFLILIYFFCAVYCCYRRNFTSFHKLCKNLPNKSNVF